MVFPVLLWLALSRFLKNLLVFLGLTLHFPARKVECSSWLPGMAGAGVLPPLHTPHQLLTTLFLSELRNVLEKEESESLTDLFHFK